MSADKISDGAAPNKGMRPIADTTVVMLQQRCRAAGDAFALDGSPADKLMSKYGGSLAERVDRIRALWPAPIGHEQGAQVESFLGAPDDWSAAPRKFSQAAGSLVQVDADVTYNWPPCVRKSSALFKELGIMPPGRGGQPLHPIPLCNFEILLLSVLVQHHYL